MTPAQVKLVAIRVRLSGVWDHPALLHFGYGACHHDTAYAILNILDGGVSLADARRIEREMERIEEEADGP